MKKPPPTTDDVLREIQRYIDAYGYSPSYGKLASSFLTSKDTIYRRVRELIQLGLLDVRAGVYCCFRLKTPRGRTEDKVRTFFMLIDAKETMHNAAERAELDIATASCLLKELRG